MKLKELLNKQKYSIHGHLDLDQSVVHFTDSSSVVKKGSCFIAVSGSCVDGHDYSKEAISLGASFLVVEKLLDIKIPQILVSDTKEILTLWSSLFFDRPSSKIKIMGVTGTNGKTTTAALIQHILNSVSDCGVIGTLEASWGKNVRKVNNTTPGVLLLNQLLSEMVHDNVPYCVMEVSSHALSQGRVSDIEFDAALFTNLSQDHLDYHGTMDSYFKAKKKLFDLFPSVKQRCINGDDEYGQKLIKNYPDSIKIGLDSSFDVYAKNIKLSLKDSQFDLCFKNKVVTVESPLICLHNIYNVLLAFSACLSMEVVLDDCVKALKTFPLVPGRLEFQRNELGLYVFIDYAHTPDAFYQVFKSLEPLKESRIITVFGCGGDRDRTKRKDMGQYASQYSDVLFLTQDNPRTESPDQIMSDVDEGIRGLIEGESYFYIENREEAIEKALNEAKQGDVVLILGKGHEDYQIIGKEYLPFSDKKVVSQWLKNKKQVIH